MLMSTMSIFPGGKCPPLANSYGKCLWADVTGTDNGCGDLPGVCSKKWEGKATATVDGANLDNNLGLLKQVVK